MPEHDRLREETSGAATATAGWDPYEVWYTRVRLPRLERERKAAARPATTASPRLVHPKQSPA